MAHTDTRQALLFYTTDICTAHFVAWEWGKGLCTAMDVVMQLAIHSLSVAVNPSVIHFVVVMGLSEQTKGEMGLQKVEYLGT